MKRSLEHQKRLTSTLLHSWRPQVHHKLYLRGKNWIYVPFKRIISNIDIYEESNLTVRKEFFFAPNENLGNTKVTCFLFVQSKVLKKRILVVYPSQTLSTFEKKRSAKLLGWHKSSIFQENKQMIIIVIFTIFRIPSISFLFVIYPHLVFPPPPHLSCCHSFHSSLLPSQLLFVLFKVGLLVSVSVCGGRDESLILPAQLAITITAAWFISVRETISTLYCIDLPPNSCTWEQKMKVIWLKLTCPWYCFMSYHDFSMQRSK